MRMRNDNRTSVDNRTNRSTRKTETNNRVISEDNANDVASRTRNNEAFDVATIEKTPTEIGAASVGTVESATADHNVNQNEINKVDKNENIDV